jgi:hypothetical protein
VSLVLCARHSVMDVYAYRAMPTWTYDSTRTLWVVLQCVMLLESEQESQSEIRPARRHENARREKDTKGIWKEIKSKDVKDSGVVVRKGVR